MYSPPALTAFFTVFLISLKQSLNDSETSQLFGTLQVLATFFVKHVTTLATVLAAELTDFPTFLIEKHFLLLLLPPSRWLRSCLFSSCSTSPASSLSSSSSSALSSASWSSERDMLSFRSFVINFFVFLTRLFLLLLLPPSRWLRSCLFSSCSTSAA